MGLQAQRAELVDADDHLRVVGLDIDGAVHQAVPTQDPVLLGLEVRIAVSVLFRSGSVIVPMPGGRDLADHVRGSKRAEPGHDRAIAAI